MGNCKIQLVAINAKYIHSNLAVYSLQKYSSKRGLTVDLAEYTINQSLEVILGDLYEKHPEVLCFSCYIWNIAYVEQLAKEFHKICPEVPIWLGGPEVSYEAEQYLMHHSFFTGVMMGEGEETLFQLGTYYKERDIITFRPETKAQVESLRQCQGLAFLSEEQQVIFTEPAELLSMDQLPFCYEHLEDFTNRIIYYETSRGCPFSCSYCLSSIDKSLRLRSLSLVYQELQFFLDHQVPQVKFVDRTFNCNHKHAMGIWQYIKDHDNGVTNFHFEVSADLLNQEELELLSTMRQGLVQFEIGVQSTNPATIVEIRRTMKLEQLKEIVKKVQKNNNIHQHLDLIAGLPLEDYVSFGHSFDEIFRLYPEQLQLGFLKVLKGSYMYQKAKDYGLLFWDTPPYEVLQTKWISFEEMQKIKEVEEVLEIYYNSGQFLLTLWCLEYYVTSPFVMFLDLAQFYKKQGQLQQQHSRLAKGEMLVEFASSYVPEKKEFWEETLLFDLYLRENLKKRPAWAKNQKKLSSEAYQQWKDRGYDKKYCHREEFSYSLLVLYEKMIRKEKFTGKCDKQHQALIFDYDHRNQWNHCAKVTEYSLD